MEAHASGLAYPPRDVGLTLAPPTGAEIEAARARIAGAAIRTPLVRLESDAGELWFKLENLQPIGSFKLRGAANALGVCPAEELKRGVWTASAGNMAQGVAWNARRLGVPCTVVVPETAPATKVAAVERLGGRVVKTSVSTWFEVFRTRTFDGMDGRFVHAFSDRDVMAGNATIAAEILEDLPDVDAVVVPFGGGGLACGIAAGFIAAGADVEVYASEVEGQAPLAAAFEAGEPVSIDYAPSFVDGIGGPHVEPEMWALANELLVGTLVVGLSEVADAIRLLVERVRVVAEGAGASSVATALAGVPGARRIACVVSGGNLDAAVLGAILEGREPWIDGT
ncbi:MAG: pyridoxal-phosphate dependent enzyme [Gemmatimonadota bacterium]|nr:pyridoxal-phosphate dependent enzyme [Gemmatimonadota bacterium]